MKTLLVLVTVSLFSTLSFAETEAEANAKLGANLYSHTGGEICKSELNKGVNIADSTAKAKGASAINQ